MLTGHDPPRLWSGYYAGLNLVMIGAITVVRFSKNFRYLSIAAIVIPYYVVCSLQVGTSDVGRV